MPLTKPRNVKTDEDFSYLVDATLVRRAVTIALGDTEGHSFEYHLHELLLAGIKAKERSIDYAEKTRLARKFSDRIAADPSIATNPEKLAALMRECKVGATKVEMKETESETADDQDAQDPTKAAA